MDFKIIHATVLAHIVNHVEEITEKMLETILTKPGTRIRWIVKLPGVPKISIKIELADESTDPQYHRVPDTGGPKGPYR